MTHRNTLFRPWSVSESWARPPRYKEALVEEVGLCMNNTRRCNKPMVCRCWSSQSSLDTLGMLCCSALAGQHVSTL